MEINIVWKHESEKNGKKMSILRWSKESIDLYMHCNPILEWKLFHFYKKKLYILFICISVIWNCWYRFDEGDEEREKKSHFVLLSNDGKWNLHTRPSRHFFLSSTWKIAPDVCCPNTRHTFFSHHLAHPVRIVDTVVQIPMCADKNRESSRAFFIFFTRSFCFTVSNFGI